METRTVTEYKVFILMLADMRGNVDNLQAVACSTSRAKLISWVRSKVVETYVDDPSPDNFGVSHSYRKIYEEGSALEWFNPPTSLEGFGGFGGIVERWIQEYPNQDAFQVLFIKEDQID